MALRSFVGATLAALLLCAAVPVAARASEPSETGYVPPVPGAVVDGWRPPASRYGAGNRGIDLAAAPGDAVRAAADGQVTFAGRIGSSFHVVVLHADGLRTSYSFLAGTDVRRGDRVHQGDVVGRAGGAVHFGVRAGDEYLDPTTLLGGGPPDVHLVPVGERRPRTEASERNGLLDGLGAIASIGGGIADALSWVGETQAAVATLAVERGWDAARQSVLRTQASFDRLDAALRAAAHVVNLPFAYDHRMDVRERRVLIDQRDCTPASVPPHAAPGRGHIAVLIGGLGSGSGHAAVLHVRTGDLGYADGSVAQFSYEGGQATGDRKIDGIAVHDDDRDATFGDLGETGARLRALLADIARTHPGVPVDLIAHSQGGIVVRAALDGADLWSPDLPVISNVITLGTPHHGAVPATAGALVGGIPGVGEAVLQGVQAATGGGVAAAATSTRELSAASPLIAELDTRALPAGTRVTSIAASGDLVVDAQMSAIDRATNAIVPVEGLAAHDHLPGDAATHREIALALSGMGTTCRDLTGDLELARSIHTVDTVPWAARLARLSPEPWAPVESSTAPGGTTSPG